MEHLIIVDYGEGDIVCLGHVRSFKDSCDFIKIYFRGNKYNTKNIDIQYKTEIYQNICLFEGQNKKFYIVPIQIVGYVFAGLYLKD